MRRYAKKEVEAYLLTEIEKRNEKIKVS